MAYYEKERCFLVLDRDGMEYQIGLSRDGFEAEISNHAVGEKLFGRLRIEHQPLHFVPPAAPTLGHMEEPRLVTEDR